MSSEELDFAVIGDEPAGLWFLGRIYEIATAPRPPETLKAPPLSGLGWISLEENVPPVCFPATFASSFGIPLPSSWSAEIITNRRALVWNSSEIYDAFPGLPQVDFNEDPLGALLHPKRGTCRAIRRAIIRNPELLSFASGLLKYLGRSEPLQPEAAVLSALYCTELAWWQATVQVPPSATRFRIRPWENPLEDIKVLSSGAIALHFRGHDPIASRRWILNTSVHTLKRLCRHSQRWLRLFQVGSEFSGRSLYPLRLKVDPLGISAAKRKLTLLFDTEEIPDIDAEVWPITLTVESHQKEIVLWTSAPAQTSLEAVLEQFRQGMGRLNRLFPFLRQTLRSLEPSLSLDTCATSEVRQEVLRALEDQSVELYGLAGVSTETRQRAISSLLPYLNCHLPYPLGTLWAASQLLTKLVGRKQVKAHQALLARPSEPKGLSL
jgi:hypothetical protein